MKQKHGFTLIELLVTLVLASILATLAVPSFREFTLNNRLTTSANTLIAHFAYARSEAVRLNQVVTVGRMGPTSGNWAQGWKIYSDAGSQTGQAAFDVTQGDLPLRDYEGFGLNGVAALATASGLDFISFRPNGTLLAAGNNVTIALCDIRGPGRGKLVSVGATGRAQITSGSPDNPINTCTP